MHHLRQISDPLEDQCTHTVQQFLVVLLSHPSNDQLFKQTPSTLAPCLAKGVWWTRPAHPWCCAAHTSSTHCLSLPVETQKSNQCPQVFWSHKRKEKAPKWEQGSLSSPDSPSSTCWQQQLFAAGSSLGHPGRNQRAAARADVSAWMSVSFTQQMSLKANTRRSLLG